MKNIRVTGKAKISVKPDTIQLLMNIEDTKKDYGAALGSSSEALEELKALLSEIGFAEKSLKTTNFSGDTVYEGYQDKNNNWKQRFAGYRVLHSVKLEFKVDNELLGKVLFELSKSRVQPEFRINYTVKNPDGAKKKLLDKAVKDSYEKAKVLAKAAGVELGEIESIDYSWEDRPIVSEPMARMMKCDAVAGANGFSMNIEADDIELADTVVVAWNIK